MTCRRAAYRIDSALRSAQYEYWPPRLRQDDDERRARRTAPAAQPDAKTSAYSTHRDTGSLSAHTTSTSYAQDKLTLYEDKRTLYAPRHGGESGGRGHGGRPRRRNRTRRQAHPVCTPTTPRGPPPAPPCTSFDHRFDLRIDHQRCVTVCHKQRVDRRVVPVSVRQRATNMC